MDFIESYKDVTEKIIGCAFQVYNKMGFGFLESVYQNCLLIELRKTGLRVESPKQIAVFYEGESVGDFVADMVVGGEIVVELKSVRQLAKAHEVQLVNYLVAINKPVGLLINFGELKVDVKRKIKQLPSNNTASEQICDDIELV